MRPSPKRVVVAVLLSSLVLLGAVPGSALAESRAGGTVTVEEGETVEGDLQAFGGTIVVRGTVEGDLQAFGGTVVLAESATVEGDASVFAGSVTVAEGATVGGSLEAAAGSITVAGTVRDDARLAGGTVVVRGTVGGDAEVAADVLTVGPNGVVGGDLEYDVDRLELAEGATVEGSVVENEALGTGPTVGGVEPFTTPNWAIAIWGFFANLFLGVILLGLLPAFSREVADRAVSSPLVSGGVGLLTVLVVPILLVLFALTIVGIPLTILGAFLFAFLVWVAAVYGGFAVGRWLLSFADIANRWAGLVLGLLLVSLVGLVPVLGGLIQGLVGLVGLGALVTAVRHGRDRRRGAGTGASPTPEEPAG